MSELLARDLAVGYGKTPLISEICLRVRSGEIVAVVGPNGAGKTTLLKTVAGLLEPQGGAVFLDSQDFKTVRPSERARRIAVMTTARAAAEFATCRDVVSVGRYQFTGVMGRLSAADRDAVDEALQTVGAQELSDAEFDKLSDGQKQRVLLARALAQEPGVLILDEPTGFLDVGYKLEFIATLKRLARDKKIGVLMTTHEIELARAAADSAVCVSADRRIDRVGPARDVLTNEYVETLFNIPRGEFGKTYGEYAPSRGSEPARSAFAAANSNRPGAKFLMIQGTMSNVGKSLIAAG
ncbi:MAG: ATP-binding cassette domain-containing protein, partial [Thermoguttaceae bacterium]|nr:ATP-binding cassette domain-containing protein [Thermoguttaceae bacterium]